jgi:hypothetical protein
VRHGVGRGQADGPLVPLDGLGQPLQPLGRDAEVDAVERIGGLQLQQEPEVPVRLSHRRPRTGRDHWAPT